MPRLGSAFVRRCAKAGYARDRLAVHFRDHIFALDILRRRHAVVGHVGHDHALLHIQLQPGRDFFGQLLHLQAKAIDVLLAAARGAVPARTRGRSMSLGNSPVVIADLHRLSLAPDAELDAFARPSFQNLVLQLRVGRDRRAVDLA